MGNRLKMAEETSKIVETNVKKTGEKPKNGRRNFFSKIERNKEQLAMSPRLYHF